MERGTDYNARMTDTHTHTHTFPLSTIIERLWQDRLWSSWYFRGECTNSLPFWASGHLQFLGGLVPGKLGFRGGGGGVE